MIFNQDVVELHVHGSTAVISAVSKSLELLGFKRAEPGPPIVLKYILLFINIR